MHHVTCESCSYLKTSQPSIHAEAYFTAIAPHLEAYTYIPFDPFPTLQSFLEWVEHRIRRDPALVLFAMIDKTKLTPHGPEAAAIAGIIGLLDTVPAHLSTELGLLFTLPASRGTHVTAHAVGLLLRWCFDTLGMRRVQWRSDPRNGASIRVAERAGFTREGVRRWDRVLPPGKAGVKAREGDECEGLHTLYLSICWDDWEDWKGRMQEVMDNR